MHHSIMSQKCHSVLTGEGFFRVEKARTGHLICGMAPQCCCKASISWTWEAVQVYLAAGDDSLIKFWDMDNVAPLTTTNAGGGLAASPCVSFSRNGIFLAASTANNGVKILGNSEGFRLLLGMTKSQKPNLVPVAASISNSGDWRCCYSILARPASLTVVNTFLIS